MSSVIVTISTCASPYIPTVIMKSISVLLYRVELRSCSYSNSLFVDYWQETGTCQQHLRETASLSVESHHEAWHFPPFSLSFSLVLSLRDCPEATSNSLLTRDFLTIVKRNGDVCPIYNYMRDTFPSLTILQVIFIHVILWYSSYKGVQTLLRMVHPHIYTDLIYGEKNRDQLKWRDVNGEQEHAAREKRSSCLDLLQQQQSRIGELVMTSAPYHDVIMSPRQCLVYVSVCTCV